MRLAPLSAVALAALVGCGSAASAPAERTGTSPSPTTSLTISFWPSGVEEGGMKRWTLRCGPAGGSHPRAAAACRRLAALKAPFAPPRGDVACIQLYGGPQVAHVKGTFRGRRVQTQLSLSDGCEIARFKELEFLVPGFKAGVGGSGS